MKKIPTLFERTFENHKVVGITDKVTPGFEWVLQGEGDATIKHDGSCCAIINDEFYKRYDAKKGKPIPEGAIKCQDEPEKGLAMAIAKRFLGNERSYYHTFLHWEKKYNNRK